MEEQYWIHIERYPHQHVLPERIVDEIAGMVAFGGVGELTLHFFFDDLSG